MKHIYTLKADTLFKRMVRLFFLILNTCCMAAVGTLAMHYLSIVMGVDIRGPADETGWLGWVILLLSGALACFTMILGLYASAKICRALGV